MVYSQEVRPPCPSGDWCEAGDIRKDFGYLTCFAFLCYLGKLTSQDFRISSIHKFVSLNLGRDSSSMRPLPGRAFATFPNQPPAASHLACNIIEDNISKRWQVHDSMTFAGLSTKCT